MLKFRLDIKNESIDRMFSRLATQIGVQRATRIGARLALRLLEFAVEAPVPTGYTGELQDSTTIEVDVNKGVVTFGFNKVYAHFQDYPRRSGIALVRPKRKKVLYIPLNRKGTRHVYGNNPANEGLVRGVDYVLAKEARIRIKQYGSDIGPNHYFSGTFDRRWKWFLRELARRLVQDRRGGDAAGGAV